MTAEELFNSICERIPEALIRHKIPGVALEITCDGQDLFELCIILRRSMAIISAPGVAEKPGHLSL
jgi:hypothetical protein